MYTFNEETETYVCNFLRPKTSISNNSKIPMIFSSLNIRDMNGNIDIPGVINYLSVYFKESEVEMLIDVIMNLDKKLSDNKKKSK